MNHVKHTAMILIHGFHGGDGTWGELPAFLRSDPALEGFEVLTWCYPAGLNKLANKAPTFWSRDPSIDTIGRSLRTMLDHGLPESIERLVLVGHSMGGLVIQSFLLEELLAGRGKHLQRVTEVVLLGTPSAGMEKARWLGLLTSQVSNMATNSQFIQTLRKHWTDEMERRLVDPNDRTVSFRLTSVVGDKDAFVPPQSALSPFPYAEQLVVPGDHRSMTKPVTQEALLVRLLRNIATRPSLTVRERLDMLGESDSARGWMSKVEAAAHLGSRAELQELARVLSHEPARMPYVWRRLGIALVEAEEYALSIPQLERYLEYRRPETSEQPFANDPIARQHLGMALAAEGRMTDAIAILLQAQKTSPDDPETLGVLAGRIKRHWWDNPKALELGYRALNLYKDAAALAQKKGDDSQVLYNAINAASLNSALGGPPEKTEAWLAMVDRSCEQLSDRDYWNIATRAEAALLRKDFGRARTLYVSALELGPTKRQRNSTTMQALDALARMQSASREAVSLSAWLQSQVDIEEGDL
jgi:pimeloyl-ACP methyl ester carboxylesterase